MPMVLLARPSSAYAGTRAQQKRENISMVLPGTAQRWETAR